MNSFRPYNSVWGSFGCSLAWMKALTTAQFALALPCIAAQILFFVRYNYDWPCIIYPTSVSSVLFFISACIGLAALIHRRKALISIYLLFGSAALMAAVVLAFISWNTTYIQFWHQLQGPFTIDSVLVWAILVLSACEVLFFMFSSLAAGIALAKFDPAFKNKWLGFRTKKLQKASSEESVHTVKEEILVAKSRPNSYVNVTQESKDTDP